MKIEKNIIPILVPNLDLDNLYNSVISDLQNRSNLKSKYLYLGWQGARLWKKVGTSYEKSKEGIELLNKHYNKIDSIIRASTANNKYNIISLGSGTSDEDLKILDIISNKIRNKINIAPFKLITIDISLDLLYYGAKRLSHKINSNTTLKENILDFISINQDFEKLMQSEKLINNFLRTNERNMYHLLGLTLGNNEENTLLQTIYKTMKNEDFLLLGLDFCGDSDAIYSNTKSQYHGEKTVDVINQYMCSPLYFASKFKKSVKDGLIDFSINYFKHLEIEFLEEPNISNVPNTTTFAYYYKFVDYNVPETMLVCYSHKYKSSEFKKYIEIELPKREIHFEIVEDICSFGNSTNGQYLVLLRKKSKAISSKLSLKSKRKTLDDFILRKSGSN